MRITASETGDGQSWTEQFARKNSGTYNNEYVVVDTKKWVAGQPVQRDLVWMIEQMPGFTKSRDVSEEFARKTYFEGISTPRFPEIWNLSDYPGEMMRFPEKADFWSFDGQIREKLIVRDAPTIGTDERFKEFMQYNDYLHADLMIIPGTVPPQREPAQGMLAKYDLRPENGTICGMPQHFGGMDVKGLLVSTRVNDRA
jgi:hypothetical protein